MDRHTREQRSKNMSAVKSSGNKSTEGAFLVILKKNKITGWRRNNKKIIGNPDFIFPKKRVVIFIDGCFWHGCKKHRNIPATNRAFWSKKISGNVLRDKKINLLLRKQGWKVQRFWEHEVKSNKNESIKMMIKSPS